MPIHALSSSAPPVTTGLANFGDPRRLWAVGAVYGRFGALCQLHEALAKRIRPEDRIVYLGNYLGAASLWSGEGKAVLDELTAFRKAVTKLPDFKADSVIFLRGRLEDLCRQLLRLPFQKETEVWAKEALEKGLGAYLAVYGVNPQALLDASTAPFIANRFTHYWQKIISGHPEHEIFFRELKLAAYTEGTAPLCFVPEGLDPRLPLHMQREAFCWPQTDIGALPAYFSYARLIRGAGPAPKSFEDKSFVLTLDGGDRLDGMIHAACLDPDGQIIEHLTF